MSRAGAKATRAAKREHNEAAALRVWVMCIDAIGMNRVLNWFRLT